MTERDRTPYFPQNLDKVDKVIRSFDAHKGKRGRGGFSIRSTDHALPNGYTVSSWKMLDWDYKKPNLPTYARGLFTCMNKDGRQEIAVRGYDKFFNQEEVRKSSWDNIMKNTKGPYELSVKENGCIIFMSGLDDGLLLVCSKHSTGPRSDVPLSHAAAGEKWIDKHLSTVGKTRQDLAKRLREMNATAVAELCDDAFEEHVLAYAPETAGLYLHGINLNLPEFVTYPANSVDAFAKEWGFKQTMHIEEENINRVKSFLEECAATGSYAGRDTEGFVIRCQARDGPDLPWHDWFFKYKFEEPYLMYRQWRECTRQVLAGKPPRYKKHKKITEAYLLFARQQFSKNPKLAQEFNRNHGIISLRDAFLREKGLRGSDIIKQESIEENKSGDMPVSRNVVLIPVATLGCGKTTVAYALEKLFKWGHVQNDNVEGRQRRPQKFAVEVCNSLMAHPAVIADRNNHQKREREQIINDVQKVVNDATFVALHYVHDRNNLKDIRKVTQTRVLDRGDNHQTIQAGSKSSEEIKGIMEGFVNRFQPVDTDRGPDDAFDLVINLDPTISSRENLERVVTQLHENYPKLFETMPSSTDMDEAVNGALDDYKPSFKQDLSHGGKSAEHKDKSKKLETKQLKNGNNGPKQPKIEFFAVKIDSYRIFPILNALFRDKDVETTKIYNQLKEYNRVQSDFHVTLIHRAMTNNYPDYWQCLVDMYGKAPKGNKDSERELGKCDVHLERLVWDERVMCFVVRLIPIQKSALSLNDEDVFKTVNPVAHITVGTASKDIKPKESNDLLQRWKDGQSNDGYNMKELAVPGNTILHGTAKAVMQRY